ncbi:MAG: GAF domain-containing protein [Anaerolineae bacterium]|nr:GAF domain-containing protein [Anaerolineae bacterium]
MTWHYTTPYMIPVILSALLVGSIAVLIAARRMSRETLPLLVLLMAVTWWNAAYAMRMGYSDVAAKIFWARVRYVGMMITPTAWFVFVLQYIGHDRWLTRWRMALLAIEPVCIIFLVWTNFVFHQLVWTDIKMVPVTETFVGWDAAHGIGYKIHTGYSYILILISVYLLLRTFAHAQGLYRGQILTILGGAFVALFVNGLSVFKLTPWDYLDLTSVGFSLACVVFAWGFFQFRLIDIAPVAYDAILEGIEDAILVLDTRNRVVNLNPAACHILQLSSSETIGMAMSDLQTVFPGVLDANGKMQEVHAEVALGEGVNGRHYEMQVSPLRRRRGVLGWCLMLHDVTERQLAEQALRVRKQLYENLVTVSRVTTEELDLETTLENTLRVAAAISGAEMGSLFIVDESFYVTHSIFTYGTPNPELEEGSLGTVMESGLGGWVVRNRKSALLSDVLLDDRWVVIASQRRTRSALCVPILGKKGSVLGVLTLTHSESGHFTTEHLALMDAAAEQMALAWYNAQVYEDQSRLARRSAILYEVLRAVGGGLNPKAVPQMAVEVIARLTGWHAVAILMPDDTGENLVVQAASSLLAVSQGWRVPLQTGDPGHAFSTGKIESIPDVSGRPGYDPHTPLRSRLLVPLRRGEHVLGVLDVVSETIAAFDAEAYLLGELLAESIALALDVAQSHAQIGGYVADLSALFAISGVISRSLLLEDLLDQTLSAALDAVGFDNGVIALLEDGAPPGGAPPGGAPSGDVPLEGGKSGGDTLSIAAEVRRRSDDDSCDLTDLMQTLCEYTYRQAKPVVVEDIQHRIVIPEDLLTVMPDLPEQFRAMRGRAFISVPLLYQDRPVGVLGLFSGPPKPSLRHDMALLMAIGRQIAMGIVNAQLFRAVEDERSRLYALIESSRDGTLFVDMEMRIVLVNVRMLELLQIVAPPEYWKGRPALELLASLKQKSVDALRDIFIEIQQSCDDAGGNAARPGKLEFDLPPKVLRWLHAPVVAGDVSLGWLMVLRDVTEERLIERMQSDMTHTMVHDLRNPLTGISGAIKILRRSLETITLTSGQYQVLEILENSSQHMLALVNAILEIGRLESGEMPLHWGKIQLDKLVMGVLTLQMPQAAEKGVRLEHKFLVDDPEAWGDFALIERTVQNLIGNAIKFTPEGGAVTAIVDRGDSDRFLVSIVDTGEGIPLDVQGRIFEKFVTGNQVGRGSGLGLAFCKMVVEAHHERLWLADTSSQGSTFTFSLSVPPPQIPPSA